MADEGLKVDSQSLQGFFIDGHLTSDDRINVQGIALFRAEPYYMVALPASDIRAGDAVFFSDTTQVIFRRLNEKQLQMAESILRGLEVPYVSAYSIDGTGFAYSVLPVDFHSASRVSFIERRERAYHGAFELLDKMVAIIAQLHNAGLAIPGVNIRDFVLGISEEPIVRLLRIEKIARIGSNALPEDDIESLIDSLQELDRTSDHRQQVEHIRRTYRELIAH